MTLLDESLQLPAVKRSSEVHMSTRFLVLLLTKGLLKLAAI